METRDLRDVVAFSEDAPARHRLFETERMWSELICLERAQQLGPISDPRADALFTIVAGEVVVQVDSGRKRLEQWGTALAPADSTVTLTNASVDPAVILVVAAPPPQVTPG
jgi:quercetin dioxygenase-like cupin family protein